MSSISTDIFSETPTIITKATFDEQSSFLSSDFVMNLLIAMIPLEVLFEVCTFYDDAVDYFADGMLSETFSKVLEIRK